MMYYNRRGEVRGKYTFLHCTVAENLYSWNSERFHLKKMSSLLKIVFRAF